MSTQMTSTAEVRAISRKAARESAGFTLEQAARRARVCPAYLRRIEKRGWTPYVLAMRLSRLYQCPCSLFL